VTNYTVLGYNQSKIKNTKCAVRTRLTEVGTETWHKISRCYKIHTGFKSLQNQFKTASNFLLADLADSTYFLLQHNNKQ